MNENRNLINTNFRNNTSTKYIVELSENAINDYERALVGVRHNPLWQRRFREDVLYYSINDSIQLGNGLYQTTIPNYGIVYFKKTLEYSVIKLIIEKIAFNLPYIIPPTKSTSVNNSSSTSKSNIISDNQNSHKVIARYKTDDFGFKLVRDTNGLFNFVNTANNRYVSKVWFQSTSRKFKKSPKGILFVEVQYQGYRYFLLSNGELKPFGDKFYRDNIYEKKLNDIIIEAIYSCLADSNIDNIINEEIKKEMNKCIVY